jgi:hypothetical protein
LTTVICFGSRIKKRPRRSWRLLGTRPTETRRPTVDTNILRKNRPEVLSPRGDIPDETPHGCYEGWVYLGFEGEDESGEPVEEIEQVPCRRCNPKTL